MSPDSSIELVGGSELCSLPALSEFFRTVHKQNPNDFNAKGLAKLLMKFCKVENASVELIGYRQARVELQRSPIAFVIECQEPLPNRVLSAGGGVYAATGHESPMPLLKGFDRKLCKEELTAVQGENDEMRKVLTTLNQLRQFFETTNYKIKAVRARLPRGLELEFSDSPHTFTVGILPDQAQLNRLKAALSDLRLESSHDIAVDLSDRAVISKRGSANAVRQ